MQLEYPDTILNIDEIKSVYDNEEKTGAKLEKDIEDLDADTSIITATTNGISHREEILGIRPQDTETIEERRFQVLLKWTDSFPYTEASLRRKIENLVGKGNYALTIDYENLNLEMLLALNERIYSENILELLQEIVPLNLRIKFEIEFNCYKLLSNYTHKELGQYTQEMLREKVFVPGINRGNGGEKNV